MDTDYVSMIEFIKEAKDLSYKNARCYYYKFSKQAFDVGMTRMTNDHHVKALVKRMKEECRKVVVIYLEHGEAKNIYMKELDPIKMVLPGLIP